MSIARSYRRSGANRGTLKFQDLRLYEPCFYEPCFYEPGLYDPGRSESRRRSSGETSTLAGISKYTPLVIFSI